MCPIFPLMILIKITSISANIIKRTKAFTSVDEECGKGPTQWHFMDQSCYYIESPDGLPYTDGHIFFFPENSIFFIETSCKGGLNIREACAVESAAKANPNRQINVLFTGPVISKCLENEPLSSIRSYKNVQLYRIHLHRYVKGSPLEKLFVSRNFNESRFPMYHTSQLLRFVTLYKYGGIYLDLDVLVLKSFDSLPDPRNWIGLEDDEGHEIGSALIAAEAGEIGRQFIETVMELINKTFPQINLETNLFKNAIRKICSTTNSKKMVPATCQGFAVYPADYFYRLHSKEERYRFFGITHQFDTTNAIALHLYQSHTQKFVILENSPCAKLMEEVCPQVYLDSITVTSYFKHHHERDERSKSKLRNFAQVTSDDDSTWSTTGFTDPFEDEDTTEENIEEPNEHSEEEKCNNTCRHSLPKLYRFLKSYFDKTADNNKAIVNKDGSGLQDQNNNDENTDEELTEESTEVATETDPENYVDVAIDETQKPTIFKSEQNSEIYEVYSKGDGIIVINKANKHKTIENDNDSKEALEFMRSISKESAKLNTKAPESKKCKKPRKLPPKQLEMIETKSSKKDKIRKVFAKAHTSNLKPRYSRFWNGPKTNGKMKRYYYLVRRRPRMTPV